MPQTEAGIRALLQGAKEAVIATAAGDEIRLRMMHLGFEDDFTIYLASMRGDPKVLQMTQHPSVAVLVHRIPEDVTEAEEVEYTGKATIIRDRQERERCLAATARTSPIVQALIAQRNTGVLDCIKIVPQQVKYRKFKEIVQGVPPTVLEFPHNRRVVSDWALLAMKLRSWWAALRPNSLAASIVPVVLGTAVAWWQTGAWWPLGFLLALGGALCLQAATNLLNDYHDHYSGNDPANRAFVRPFGGGSRVIQLGLLTPLEVLVGTLVLALAAAVTGVGLALAGRPLVLPLAAFGALIGALYNRSGGWNLIRLGLGELAVGGSFGVLITLGAFYVQAGGVSLLAAAGSLPVALLVTAVLFINEFQDEEADRRTGKATYVARCGRQRAAAVFPAFFLGAYGLLAALVAAGLAPAAALLAVLTAPLALLAVRRCRHHHGSPVDLAPANGYTALCHLAFGLLQALGYVSAAGPAVTVSLAAVFVAFTLYMYRYTERLRRAAAGVQRAMARA